MRQVSLLFLLVMLISVSICAAWCADPPFIAYPQHYAEKVFADKPPMLEQAGKWAAERKLSTFAARGEYEPLSVVIFPPDGAQGVMATAGDLTSEKGAIPASAVDLRWVKCWYQAKGCYIRYDFNARFLDPELLVKDPGWLKWDHEKKRNDLVPNALPVEPADLQPVDIPKGFVQQLWITIKVPENAETGTYKGAITISAGAYKTSLPLTLEVMGWSLLPPAKDVSLYTGERGGLSEEIHRAQDRDMKEHGLTVGYMYDNQPDYANKALGKFGDAMRLYQDAGLLNARRLLAIASGVNAWNDKPDDKFITDQQAKARDLVALIRKGGYQGDICVYGADEWGGKELEAASKTYRGLQQAGVKVFVACGDDYYRYAGNSIDLPVLGIPTVKLSERSQAAIARSHADGLDVWSYVPFTTMAQPMTFRYRLGFWQWNAPIDGTCLWAYMDGTTAAKYENFPEKDKGGWMDSMLAYPTAHGVIDTIQWEGFREGVDDMRYATTLLGMVLKADRLGIKGKPIDAARKLATTVPVADDERVSTLPPTRWAEALDVQRFDARRREIADAVTQLLAQYPQLALTQADAQTMPGDVRAYLKKTYPVVKGAMPFGVRAFPGLYQQMQQQMQDKHYYQAVQTGWELLRTIDAARAKGTLDAVQYGVLIDTFVDDFHTAELEFVRTTGPDGKFVPGEIINVYEPVMDLTTLDWKFKPDWYNEGRKGQWFNPALDSSDWRKIKVTTWWELQGYDDLLDLDGAGWYRATFTVPKEAEKRRLFLHVGAADEWCTVWVNGKEIATHPGYSAAWARPFQMELTPALKPGAENVLVIRVFDSSQAGGLWNGLDQLGAWKGMKLLALKEGQR